MQDREHNNFDDKSFVNSSWKEMKFLLDRDIPVAINPLKRITNILGSLLLVTFSALSYFVYLQITNIPTAAFTKEIILYKSIHVEGPSFLKKKKDNFLASLPQNISQTGNQEVGSILEMTNNKDVDLLTNSKLDLKATDNEQPPVKRKDDRPQNLITIQDIESVTDESICMTSPIPILSQTENLTVVNDNSRQAAEKNIIYNIGLLSFVSQDMEYSGYGIVSGVQIPLSQRLRLQTGLAINFISRGYFVFPFIANNNEDYLKSLSNLEDQGTYYSGLKSFKQFYLPLNINYNLTDFLSLSTGFKFRYTYSEEVDNVLKSRASSKISKSQTVENAFFNNTNIGISAGVSYHFNNRVNLILDSEWGFSSIINRQQFMTTSTTRKYDLNLINLTTNFTF